MGIFIAFALGVLSAVYAPKLAHKTEKAAVEEASAGYIKISDVKCPVCLLHKQKSRSMVIDIKDDLGTRATEYRCTRGHEWTVVVTKEDEKP